MMNIEKELIKQIFLSIYNGDIGSLHLAFKQAKIIADCLTTGYVPSNESLFKMLDNQDDFRLYER